MQQFFQQLYGDGVFGSHGCESVADSSDGEVSSVDDASVDDAPEWQDCLWEEDARQLAVVLGVKINLATGKITARGNSVVACMAIEPNGRHKHITWSLAVQRNERTEK